MHRDRAFWLTALAVASVFVFALFVRTYWNIEAATPAGTFVLSESDAYYIHHSVERIQTEGWSHPVADPLVNYPVGGVNPNPPLWEWWIATFGALLTPFFGHDAAGHPVACPAGVAPSQAVCVSTWWVTVASPALFGALTCLVVVLLGRELWGWRVGLLGGFFAATSTSHIERSVLGFADHDSFVLLFIVLAFFFFIKALQRAKEARWVERWGELASVRAGLGSYVRANHLSLAFAAMAGVAIAGVGLSWKGYAFAGGILLAFGIVQLLVNHWRQRDSTHVFMTVSVALLVGTLLTVPYYANPGLGAVFDTLLPVLFITLAWLAFGAIFTASRDYPFVLVLPTVIVLGILALVAAFFLAPSVAQTLLGPLVYFKQTKLYTTIAEAHPADFNTVVFGTGVVAFFIALFAIPYLLWTNRKLWRPSWTFVAIWALLSMYMTQNAVRFMFNATPIFALLAGWGTGLLIARLRFETIGKNLAGLGGVSRDALKRAINGWHIVGALLLAFILVLPNVLLSVDAGMPSEFEDKLVREDLAAQGLPFTAENRATTFVGARMGAFGQGFITDYWRGLFEWLSTQDTEVPQEQRPAFLSWWDYGHWALSLGRHPAVADNFQNGFQFAGDFIAAENETHAIQLMIARIADSAKSGKIPESTVLGALQGAGLTAVQAREAYASLTDYANPDGVHGYTSLLTLDQAAAALRQLERDTGQWIRYYAVDVRLFPYDNPSTPRIDFGSIFYAPMTLSDHNPDDYVEVKIAANVQGEFEKDPVTGAPDPRRPKREFTVAEFNEIQRDVRRAQGIQGQVSEIYSYKEKFFNTTFYKAYIGTPLGLSDLPATTCDAPQETFPVRGDRLPGIALPGHCMEHFRLSYFHQNVRMLRYYPGATVQGTVTVDGQPLEGATVLVYDDAGDMMFADQEALLSEGFKDRFRELNGRNVTARDLDVPHDSAVTGANGTWTLTAPYATTGQVRVVAFKDGAPLGNVSYAISMQDAEAGRTFDASLGALDARSGSVSGQAFFDRDQDQEFDDTDDPLPGVRITERGTNTTGADGRFRIGDLAPGQHTFDVELDDYELPAGFEARVTVLPGQEAPLDIPLVLTKVPINGTVWRDIDGDGALGPEEGVPGVQVKSFADFRDAANTAFAAPQAFTGINGSWPANYLLSPGSYVLRGEWTNLTDGSGWAFGALVEPAKGSEGLSVPTNVTRLVRATPVSVNVTLEREPGNLSAAPGAEVLFVPVGGSSGLPAADRTPANGTLTLRLAQGEYDVWSRSVGDETFSVGPVRFTVTAEPANLDLRLTRP